MAWSLTCSFLISRLGCDSVSLMSNPFRPGRSWRTPAPGRRLFSLGASLAFAAFGLTCRGATIEELRAIYDQQLERAQSDYSSETVMAEYAAQLEASAKAAQEAGDLMGLLALQKEQERIRTDKTIPTQATPNTEKRLVSVREQYGRKLAEIGMLRDRKIQDLALQYVQKLKAEGSALVKSGDIEGAVRMRDEQQRVESSPEVVAAQFGVASAPSSPADGEGAAAAATTSTTDGGAQTAKSRKRVSARGSMTGGWTATATRVAEGEKVSVSASGRWQCFRMGAPCGPEGYPYRRWNTQFEDANYGALLCRVGSAGKVRAVGERLEFEADATGVLQFYCNVREDPDVRKQCSGDMDVEIEVVRKAAD